MAVREWDFVTACNRHGVKPGPEMVARSLATLCPACPQPGINMDPDWKDRPPDQQCVQILDSD